MLPEIDATRLLAAIGRDGARVASVEGIGALLREAAADSPILGDALLDRGDVAAGLASLVARWTDTDGLVRAVDAVRDGAIVHDVANVAHGALPDLDLVALTGVDLGPGAIVVSGPLGRTTWPGVADDHILDLRAPALVPEAFDLARVTASDGP